MYYKYCREKLSGAGGTDLPGAHPPAQNRQRCFAAAAVWTTVFRVPRPFFFFFLHVSE